MNKLLLTAFVILFTALSYAQNITVTVSIPPQKYIADKLSEGKIKVNVMVPKGSDPHIFSPKASQIKQLADSALYLAIGFPFEDSMLPQISKSYKNLLIIKTQEGVNLFSEDEGYLPAVQTDGKNTKKTHIEETHPDPHIWTSPKQMIKIAENTFNALVKADPVNRAVYEKNCAALLADIRTADNKFNDLFNNTRISGKFLVYHPAWSYFARDYGLKQYAIEVEGKPPKAKELKAIIEKARAENIKVFLAQPQHSANTANNIAKELGIKIYSIDILDENWMDIMAQTYGAFAGAVR